MTAETTRTLTPQVLVVGGGPVGLMLAGELRLGGADVLVVERRDAPTTESRASTLHARTMEILDSRGLLGALGTPPREPLGHFGGIPLSLELPGPHAGQWKVPQTRTEELLEDWARSLGAVIARRHELHRLTVRDDHVEAGTTGPDGPVRVRAEYAVACDGEDSTVRRLTGAAFPGHDARRELLRADVAGIDIPDRRFERLPHGLAIAARRADGVTRVMVHEFGSTPRQRPGAPEFGEIAAVWRRVTGEDIGDGTPLWRNAFGDACRQLTQYRHGRLLFAGDAAHRQPPIGGQALNLGLQDAVNLGWKLAATVDGWAPPGLLDSYHTERHAVGRRVLDSIETQAGVLFGGPESEPQRALLAELMPLEPVRLHLAGMISGLDIRYPADDADDAEAPANPLVGTRLPYAALRTDEGKDSGAGSTFALLRAGRGVLLDFGGGDGGALLRAAAPWASRVRAVAATPTRAPAPTERYPTGLPDGTGAVLVRPDGHVAWAAPRAEAYGQAPLAALRRWFGDPAPTPEGTGG
ncbi:FAD-dependent monooxygenase [Streptomyces sp. TRM49041]|uniref:FAD-dependent monooxygenase n=1 Tax=Streptomyces sp. TRM49041 TaxID=2603216 RepID=UPI0021CCD495|nr:FAD-dependent monooxygenase [Streptomyces sp. TRM49041]